MDLERPKLIVGSVDHYESLEMASSTKGKSAKEKSAKGKSARGIRAEGSAFTDHMPGSISPSATRCRPRDQMSASSTCKFGDGKASARFLP